MVPQRESDESTLPLTNKRSSFSSTSREDYKEFEFVIKYEARCLSVYVILFAVQLALQISIPYFLGWSFQPALAPVVSVNTVLLALAIGCDMPTMVTLDRYNLIVYSLLSKKTIPLGTLIVVEAEKEDIDVDTKPRTWSKKLRYSDQEAGMSVKLLDTFPTAWSNNVQIMSTERNVQISLRSVKNFMRTLESMRSSSTTVQRLPSQSRLSRTLTTSIV